MIAANAGQGCGGRRFRARRARNGGRSSRVVLSRQCRGQVCEMAMTALRADTPRRRRWQKSWFTGEITEQP